MIEPGAYLFERNVNTQLWSHPDDINIANFDFGITYMKWFANMAGRPQSNELNHEQFTGGVGFAVPLGVFNEQVQIDGFLATLEDQNAFTRFFAKHRKISQETAYMVILNYDGTYVQYAAPDDDTKDFAPGYIANLNPMLLGNPKSLPIKGIFQIVWGAL